MASPRTASVTLELMAEPNPWLDGGGAVQRSLEDIVGSYPDARSALMSLRDAGWRLRKVFRDSVPAATAGGSTIFITSVEFTKDFVGAKPIDVSDDVRRCGVTDDFGPVFDWTPDAGDDDDGCWDLWEGEL